MAIDQDMNMKKMKSVFSGILTASALLAPMAAQAVTPPWDDKYSGTYDMECDTADYAGGAVLWMNGVGTIGIPLGTMEGECDENGVRPSQEWLQARVVQPFIDWCEDIEARVNQFGTLTGFTDECDRVANEYAALFTRTIQHASPQPWKEYTVDWRSTHWNPWPGTHLFPNPFANDPHIDYVTTTGYRSNTGNVIIGWAIDGKANGITTRPSAISRTIELPENYSLQCEIGAQAQHTHHAYDGQGGVTVINNDAAAISCFTYNNDFLETLDIDSAGFVIGADLRTVSTGERR